MHALCHRFFSTEPSTLSLFLSGVRQASQGSGSPHIHILLPLSGETGLLCFKGGSYAQLSFLSGKIEDDNLEIMQLYNMLDKLSQITFTIRSFISHTSYEVLL
jgi:hypothetical protein